MATLNLKQLCLLKIAREVSKSEDPTSLSVSAVWLPNEVSQTVFDFCMNRTVHAEVNQVFKLFLKCPGRTPLQKVYLQNNRRADGDLVRAIVKANVSTLTHLDIRGCSNPGKKLWRIINHAPELRSFKTSKLLKPLHCPHLEYLTIDCRLNNVLQRVQYRFQPKYYDKLIQSVLPTLKYLDLSWCPWTKRLTCLCLAQNLEILVLRNCDITPLLDDIICLGKLRSLDISVPSEGKSGEKFKGKYTSPASVLSTLVKSLENLESLDISGTNLDQVDFEDTSQSDSIIIPGLRWRRENPLQFLGLYETFNEHRQIDDLPSNCISGSTNGSVLVEAIKRNYDMPKTLHNQVVKLRSFGMTLIGTNELLDIELKILKNVRHTEYFRYWACKCVHNFLNDEDISKGCISVEKRAELLRLLNRIIYSHLGIEKIPEPTLCLAFQIYLKLLPCEQSVRDSATLEELMRFGKFLMMSNTRAFVYLKTEALMYRVLCRLSSEPCVCKYLYEKRATMNCFNFFNTLQIHLGFSLSVRQTAEIVPLVWRSLLNLLKISSEGNNDFLKNRGLNWMYSHLYSFSSDGITKQELCRIFTDILRHVEPSIKEDNHIVIMPLSPSSFKKLFEKVNCMVKNEIGDGETNCNCK